MNCLIVGCGYLGQRVAERWLRASHAVSALTRNAETARRFRSQGIEPVLGDVTDRESLSALPAADVLLYAVGFDRNAPQSRHQVYVDGLNNVLDALAGRVGRIVYISSSSVYGNSNGEWIDETTPCQPTQPGGIVCREAEQALANRLNSGSNSTSHVVLRLTGIYGPGRLLRRQEELEQQTPISGRPDAWLNLIHVDDAADITVAVAKASTLSELYLVSDDRPVERQEYYSQLAELFGTPPPNFADDNSDPGRVQGLGKRCSNQRLKSELDLKLNYPTIVEGLKQAING